MYAWHPYPRRHETAKAWFERQVNSGDRVGIPWMSLLAFIRLSTNPRMFERPVSFESALTQVHSWLDIPTVWVPEATTRHARILEELLRGVSFSPNIVGDAHLAALALEHGLTVCSADSDFAKFPAVRWLNPFQGRSSQ